MDEFTLKLQVLGPSDADDLEVDDITKQLRQRILDLDVQRAELVRLSDAPEGAKPGEVIAIGAMLVTVAPPVLTAVVELVKAWVAADRGRSVELTLRDRSIKIGNATTSETSRLLAKFLEDSAASDDEV